MLQKNRSAKSKSFLREIEFALFLFQEQKIREDFLNKARNVFEKRHNPNITKTGEKDLKTEILAFLKTKGEIKTANIWARDLEIDKRAIDELLALLQQELLSNNIQGILEIHLQDREINSPHIQFIGLNAELAEVLIAKILVEKKYETSIESALSKKVFIPYYEINPKKIPTDLREQIEIKESQKDLKIDIEILDKGLQEAKKILDTFRKIQKDFTQRLKSDYGVFKKQLLQKNNRIRKLRRRIFRRK